MIYAVVKTGGKQYRVSQGDLVQVEKIKGETGDRVAEAKIGTPTLPEAKVTAEIVEHRLAKKIIVFKKKRRKSYSRKQGHRQRQTTLRITEIQG
jgi:large subunit ribosomal protein L21